MKNFIHYNIQNIKGSKRAYSLIDKDNHQKSPPKKSPPHIHKQPPIQSKLTELESKINRIQQNNNQSLILQQLSSIKEDIRMIKSHIFEISKEKNVHGRHNESTKIKTHSSYNEDDENVYTLQINSHNKGKMNSQQDQSRNKKSYKLDEILNNKIKRASSSYNKNSYSLKAIYPLLKDYKLEGPQYGTIFYGYSKRNSQAVAIKYSQQSLNHIIQVYDKLWKNIGKAKWACINKIYDYKSDDLNIIVMEKNKGNILGLPPISVIIDILKILQFIHECGYLYRNIEPEHFMLNQDGQLVIIDFKRAKRYIDVKGHPIDVVENTFNTSPFASNNQVRGLSQGRKDDLQSLGYLALLLLQYDVPWATMNKQQTIRIRSNLTLQQLYHHNYKWVQYMAIVAKTNKNEKPNYKRLLQILQN